MPAMPDHSELDVTFTRSSGPGGQNVNRRSTRVQVRWNVGRSAVFTEAQKAAIRRAAGKRLNADDDIVLASEDERSQFQNRQRAIARLEELIAAALAPRKVRVPTKVGRGRKRKRLDAKRRAGDKKRSRRPPSAEW